MTAILQNAITGQTDYTAQWFSLAGTSQGAAVTMTEGLTGTYTANPPGSMAASTDPYILVIKKAAAEEGRTQYFWDGTREINIGFLRDRLAAIVGEVWSATARSLTDKIGYALSSASITAIWAETTRTLTSFGTLAADVWTATTRSLTAPVTTDTASRAVVTQLNTDFLALLSGDKSRFTATALINAPTGSGGGGGATAGDIATAVWTATTRSLTDKVGYELAAAERTAIGTSVWATATRSLTDKTGFDLTTTERTAIGTSVWATTTRALTDKANFALSSAERTSIWTNSSRTLTGFGTLAADVWTSTTRSLTAPVTTDADSRALVTQLNTDFLALLAPDKSKFTTIALSNSPGSGGGGATSGDIATAVWAATTRSLTDKVGYELSSNERTAIGTSVWGTTTRALTDKSNFALSAAERTSIWTNSSRTLTSFGTLPNDVWLATTRSLTAAVTTDEASRTATAALVTGFATPANVTASQVAIIGEIDAIPTNPLLAGDYVAPDNAGIASLTALVADSKFTADALSLTPTSTSGGPALTTEQALQLKIAAARATNRIKVDSLTNVETLYDDNNSTPLVQRSLKGIDGLPNSEDVYESLPI